MVVVTSTYYPSYSTTPYSPSAGKSGTGATTTPPPAATSVTLSDAARAALSERDLATVLSDARAKLAKLLEEVGRTSPLQGEELALDLSSLDARELYALASDKNSKADESEAATLEMQRRLEAALSGPLAIANVTGDFTGLYKAAASYFDSLGPEEKASADWKAGRDALTEGLKQLQTDPKRFPDAGEDDPVALYMALVEAKDATGQQSMVTLAANARAVLNRRYADAHAAGKTPSFNPYSSRGAHIDLSDLSSRSLSAIVLNEGDQFTETEIKAAQSTLRTKSSAALMAGLKAAGQSGDPSAFSQNVIAAFSSLSPEERQAAGWSDKLYEAAMANYTTSSKLMQMFTELSGTSPTTKSSNGLSGLLGSF
ncbi:MAG: hypothetical protein IR164_12540 [Devosia sp.]|uniref:hypothetical protein n=1 Tax=Devosia sp. TaxID=1871048 RepID=UPI0019D928F0|nr:hypothetical protein [Devosia sp.]MBF0679752.1 hypothetical protein [Devosia sp.]